MRWVRVRGTNFARQAGRQAGRRRLLFTCAGRIAYFDPDAERIFGWRSDEVIAKPISMLFSGEEHRPYEAALASPSAASHPIEWEAEGLRKEGAAFPLGCCISPCRLDGDVLFLAVLRDLQEERRRAEEVVHMDRMMALGKLAAGVAHEINNPLSYVISNLDFVKREIDEVVESLSTRHPAAKPGGGEHAAHTVREVAERLGALRTALREARDGTERIKNITRDLRTFAHVDEDRRERVPIGQALDSAINLAWNEIHQRAGLVRDYASPPAVMANEQRLVQVFLNLLVNAAHAIDEGPPEQNEIRVRAVRQGERVQIEIADTGRGIEQDVIPRLFEPFFTTRRPGQGTGLGLSVARDIVRTLGGDIGVESEPGKGSVFRVDLPAEEFAESAPPSPTAVQGKREVTPPRRGRILVVDDEPLIGSAVRRMLGAEHDIVDVSSGRRALALLESGARFDVILCDLMMPRMGGTDFSDACARFPGTVQRIVFMTGGAFTDESREFLARVENRRLEKPFEAEDLRAVVRDLLA